MPMRSEPDTEQLLDAAARGDDLARGQLLERHRPRLRRMIAVRLDRRLAARVDPSDVVQETLAEAAAKLNDYLCQRPLAFYPWLRRLAQEQLARVGRRHLRAGRRSVTREEPAGLPDESVLELAERLLDAGSGPSTRLRRVERQALVRQALDRLPEGDREVLVLRYLEQLSTAEAAAVLEVGESAVKMRLLRALQRLRDLLNQSEGGP
jgi:RNA polymerase sigma-70 factor (ECF subfamily)